jgi:hypothetical protein
VTLTDAVTRRIDIYLGDYGTPESRAEYDRTLSDGLAGGRVVERAARQAYSEAARPLPQATTVTVVVRRFWPDTQARYSKTRRLNILPPGNSPGPWSAICPPTRSAPRRCEKSAPR